MNIETNRLILVPVSEEHTDEIFEHFNEKIITYMAPSALENMSQAKEVVQKFIDQRTDNTDYIYAITLKNNGEFIGIVGLHDLKNDVPELGVWIKLSSHGNHYGREAVGGAIDFARTLGIEKMCYPVDLRNISSRKIPFFYGGKLIVACKIVETPDGRTLEEEIYEI